MSLLIGGISKDGILMCGDTRVSTEILGTRYKLNDNFRKVHIIDNRTIMFIAGRTMLCSDIVNHFNKAETKDIDTLIGIAKECIEHFIGFGGTGYEGRFVQIVLGKYENEKFNIYLAEDSHNWKIQKAEGGNFIVPFTGGYREEEAMNLWNKRNEQIAAEGRTISFSSVANSIYNDLSDEGIGGMMTAVFLKKDGASEEIYAIKDNKNIKKAIMSEQSQIILNDVAQRQDCVIQGELRVGLAGNNSKGVEFYGDSFSSQSECYGKMIPWVDASDDHIKGINVSQGEFWVNGYYVATEKDITALKIQIEQMAAQIKQLEEKIETLM